MLTVQDVQKALGDDERIPGALEAVDQDAYYEAERSRLAWEEWDRTSAINGVDAEHFLARSDVNEGPVYLIRRDEQIVYFQPHMPREAGLIEIANLEGVAAGHVEELAQAAADAATLNQVRRALDL